jgi:uncharacterized protein YuzE
MKLQYYPESDSLYIELKSVDGAECREISEGFVVDFDSNGDVIGLDIDHASRTCPKSRRSPCRPPTAAEKGTFPT